MNRSRLTKLAIRASNEPGVAAIATATAASLHNLKTLAPNVHSFQGSFRQLLLTQTGDMTRFIVISKYFAKTPTGKDSSLIRFDTRQSAGALSGALSYFTENNINLTSIESRPSPEKEGGQRFLIEVDGHLEDEAMKKAIGLLSKTYSNVHLVGTFQR